MLMLILLFLIIIIIYIIIKNNKSTNISNQECLGNSTKIVTNNLAPNNCYCPLSQVWNGSNCVDVSYTNQCPTGTSIDGLGSIINIGDCKCNNYGEIWVNNECVYNCPSGTIVSGYGEQYPDNPNCKCPYSGQQWINNKCSCPSNSVLYADLNNPSYISCEACPTGTTITGYGGQHTSIIGCKCQYEGQQWSMSGCTCLNNEILIINNTGPSEMICSQCPYDTYINGYGEKHPSYTTCKCAYTGQQWSITGCICPLNNYLVTDNSVLGNKKCAICPSDTSITGLGGYSIYPECKCDINKIWNGTTCVLNCPTETSTTNTGESSSLTGCNCPIAKPIYNIVTHQCQECPLTTSTSNTGLSSYPDHPLCKCPYNYSWNTSTTQCMINCPNGTSRTNTGEDSSIVGCKCPISTPIYNNITQQCQPCPLTTSTTNIGNPHPDHPLCKCLDNYSWNTSTTQCMENCPSGTNRTNTGEDSYVTGCKCPINNPIYNIITQQCQACPTTTSTSNTGKSYPDHPLCKCPDNQYYNYTQNICTTCYWPDTAVNFTGGSTSENIDCHCPAGKTWYQASQLGGYCI